ncbi:MAG TPA: hypothetical protein VFT12_12605 [Thermoanaerobaculia bacterium]|nr:hypothetical protein [Thermoanaerobaculia bacterium]
MVKKRIVDNRNRPAQPEPGEDPAVKKVPVRKQATKPTPKKK